MDNKQKEKFKKALVFSGLGLLCAASLWFIFQPSGTAPKAGAGGLNKDVPQASAEQLPGNKLKAYEHGEDERREEQAREQMGRLSDYFPAREEGTAGEMEDARSATRKIETSMQRYEENNRLLSSFYEPDPAEERQQAMQEEIETLKKQLGDARERKSEAEEEEKQLRFMENSYKLAAKYMPKGTSPLPAAPLTNAEASPQQTLKDKGEGTASTALERLEVRTAHRSVVSSLAQPVSDTSFVKDFSRPRNLGFVATGQAREATVRNALRVTVDRTTTLRDGDAVILRLMEDARMGGRLIPRQSRLVATAKIEGNRMRLTVKSMETDGSVFAVKLSAFDTDGQEGLYIPGLEDVEALKEIGANVGGSMGTSFTFSSSAKDQILSEAARGLMQGASQLLQKKLRTVKVTLKGGHRLFLVQGK